MKVCSRCGIEKPLDQFYKCYHKTRKPGVWYRGVCKRCQYEQRGAYWKTEKGKASNRRSLIRFREKAREDVFHAYGGDHPSCRCCGEDEPKFLTVDHINGGGTKHRQSTELRGKNFYAWLRRNGYPKGYQLLCCNCNMAKAFFGQCPHQCRPGRQQTQ